MITTIKLKDLIKYLVGVIIVILITISSTRFFYKLSKDGSNLSLNLNIEKILNMCMLVSKYNDNTHIEKDVTKKYTSRSGVTRILGLEIPNIKEKNVEENNKEIAQEDYSETESNEGIEQEEQRETVQIEDKYTNTYGSVTVKNLTNIKLTESMLKPDYEISNKKNILIYHTHTCESYTPTKANSYEASGNYRTIDMNYSVVKVGRVLKQKLEDYKFKVIQDETKHDYPAYSGSYTRSLETVTNMLKNTNAEIVFDIHRDAIGSNSNYAPTVEINGQKVAQLMFVIGTNDGGGKHPNWNNNLKVAIKIQEKANEMYPGLFRSINLRSSVFNQRVTNGASIIEVGATGNTLEEAELSMKYLAEILNCVLN